MRSAAAALLFSLVWAGSAQASICDDGHRPAATLLLPYFEVDLDDPLGIDTQFFVRNVSANPAVAHVSVYSDLGVAVVNFLLYLEGFQQRAVGMRDLIVNGVFPVTDSPPGSLPVCANLLPTHLPLPAAFLNHAQTSLTGKASPINGLCFGRQLGDNVARGYAVVNTLNDCIILFPGDAGYFGANGTGAASNQNVLTGNYVFVSLDKKQRSYGGSLVHLEASGTDPETSTAGQATFYGRYTNWSGADNREPLPTTFGIPLRNVNNTTIVTDLLVWRDPKVNQAPFACPAVAGVRPSWFPLSQERAVAFDSFGNAQVLTGALFPAVAQRVRVGSPELPITVSEGWLYLSLNASVAAAAGNPPEDPAAAGGWATAVWADGNRFTVGLDGTALDDGCQALHSHP